MAATRKEIEQPITKKQAQELYSKYMNLALECRIKGDRALFEGYYQRAEYYLHLMNKFTILPGKAPNQPKPPFKGPYLGRHRHKRSTQKLLSQGI